MAISIVLHLAWLPFAALRSAGLFLRCLDENNSSNLTAIQSEMPAFNIY